MILLKLGIYCAILDMHLNKQIYSTHLEALKRTIHGLWEGKKG
jgi:hypothetical protein